MNRWGKTGFTIVELLIVVVVIAILASITIVAYNGIRERSQSSALTATLKGASQKVHLYAVDNADQYPATLAAAGVKDTDTVTYQYTTDTVGGVSTYCLTATYNQSQSVYFSSTAGKQNSGICPGHNTLVWYKSVAGAALPLADGAVDTSVFRSGDRSMRIAAGKNGVPLRGSPFNVTPGQVYTVSFWMQTDASWNGTDGNSKVRFGNQGTGGLIRVCGYSGVKISWTQVTCTLTVPAGVSQLVVSVGNDAGTGNIWLDDISLSVTGP